MIKYAKENFIHKIDDILGNPEIGNSSKRIMQVMGRFMGKTGTSINIPALHKQDNTLAFSDFEKAQELNNPILLPSLLLMTPIPTYHILKNVVM